MSTRENRLSWARGKAAQAWCTEQTESTVMDTDLAEAFAEILNKCLFGTPLDELLDDIEADVATYGGGEEA